MIFYSALCMVYVGISFIDNIRVIVSLTKTMRRQIITVRPYEDCQVDSASIRLQSLSKNSSPKGALQNKQLFPSSIASASDHSREPRVFSVKLSDKHKHKQRSKPKDIRCFDELSPLGVQSNYIERSANLQIEKIRVNKLGDFSNVCSLNENSRDQCKSSVKRNRRRYDLFEVESIKEFADQPSLQVNNL